MSSPSPRYAKSTFQPLPTGKSVVGFIGGVIADAWQSFLSDVRPRRAADTLLILTNVTNGTPLDIRRNVLEYLPLKFQPTDLYLISVRKCG